MNKLHIRPYSPEYERQVQLLILKIQQTEFNIDIDIERQPDLKNISSYYQHGLGNFWVASIQDTVIGTISLLDIGDGQTALRKMFVESAFRGKEHHVGQQLLDTVIQHCKTVGVNVIYLGTTEKFIAAQRFYKKNSFIQIQQEELPKTFPVMAVDKKFYKRSLLHSYE